MNLILDLLFPKKCIGCGKSDTYFCQGCISNILQTDLVCPECEQLAIGGQTHPICRRRFGLDGLWSLGIYQDSLKKAIQKIKYEPSLVRDFAPVLTDMIVDYWARFRPYILDLINKDQGQGWAIIPVPLHWYRENSRGFNQSFLFGQLLSKKLGLTYCDPLKRIRYTKPQAQLKGYDRHQNIQNAFALASSQQSIAKSVLLIDDVWTTGSTLRECCYVLKRAGAQKVWALTLAR